MDDARVCSVLENGLAHNLFLLIKVFVRHVVIIIIAWIFLNSRLISGGYRILSCKVDRIILKRLGRRCKMLLQLICDGSLNVFVVDPGHIALHKRANGLIHSFRAHLERVADFDAVDALEGILPCDWLIWVQSMHFEVVFGLFEALITTML